MSEFPHPTRWAPSQYLRRDSFSHYRPTIPQVPRKAPSLSLSLGTGHILTMDRRPVGIMARVFVSYSRTDAELAGRIQGWLADAAQPTLPMMRSSGW